MARTCVWCGDPLPEPQQKGHRRREFCKRPKNCKQQHYLWHKQMKHDADQLADPFWRVAYAQLVEHYKFVERLLQERVSDLTEAQERIDRLKWLLDAQEKRLEEIRVDYAARLKALGLSQQEINEFEAYWREQSEKLHWTDE